MKLTKPKGIEYLDYLVLIQVVVVVIWSLTGVYDYEPIKVYFSAVLFISYWLLRIVFNPRINRKI